MRPPSPSRVPTPAAAILRRAIWVSLLLILHLNSAPALPGESTLDAARTALAAGKTEKAARLVEKALPTASADDVPALRFLLLKAYVLDLGQEKGALYKEMVGEAKDGLERFTAKIDSLEAELRAEGARALPPLLDALARGEDLDRLLVLGLLGDLAAAQPELPWRQDAGEAVVSPLFAAASAVGLSIDQCVAIEASEGDRKTYVIEDAAKRDRYVQAAYSIERGLEFLQRVDVAEFAESAAAALECRVAAGAVLADRTRLNAAGALLPPPLRRRLDRSPREDVKRDALELLGRYGSCDDLDDVEFYIGVGRGDVQKEATQAAQRIEKRGGCAAARATP